MFSNLSPDGKKASDRWSFLGEGILFYGVCSKTFYVLGGFTVCTIPTNPGAVSTKFLKKYGELYAICTKSSDLWLFELLLPISTAETMCHPGAAGMIAPLPAFLQ